VRRLFRTASPALLAMALLLAALVSAVRAAPTTEAAASVARTYGPAVDRVADRDTADVDPPCANAPVPGSRGVHLSYGDTTRFFQIHVPPHAAAGHKLPLVLALHGAGSSGTKMETYSGFSGQADRYGFVAVYPSALGATWNITAAPAGANDVGYTATVISIVKAALCVDPNRVYATGVSNGAGMVALLGCALSSQLTAIAPVDGVYNGQPPCQPTRPVSVLEIHGTADTIAPYYAGAVGASAVGPPPLVRAWVHRDSCNITASTRTIAIRTVLYRWSGCSGAAVEHIRIQGGTHQWPGANPPDPGPPTTLCGACAIWSFFSPLRPAKPVATSYSGGAGVA
jgi:polyhydroxybutyrate depolymerase